MSYEVIARKWRPQMFDEVIGQDHVVRTLKNAIENNRIAQAYLFAGPRGTGKTTLARIFARSLNCEHGPTVTPCGKCSACRGVADGSSFDFTELDGATHNSVDAVREQIIDHLNVTPSMGRYHIYYIDEVHMLSPAAFNALLKSLEEPPEFVKFIFATTEPERILSTIISRCQRFDLRKISIVNICAQLRKICAAEGVEISEDALLAIARGADGGMRDAESALDQLIAFTGKKITEQDVLGVFGLVSRSLIEQLAEAVLTNHIAMLITRLDELDQAGKDLRRLTAELIDYFRNLLVCIELSGDTSSLDITEEQKEALEKHRSMTTASAALSIVEELIRLDGTLRLALSQRTLVETALIRCARSARLVDLETILKKITQLEKNAAASPAAAASPVPKPVSPAPAPAVHAAPAVPVPVPAEMPAAPSPLPERRAAPPAEESSAQPLINVDEVLQDPVVKSALETFGGRITDIR